MTITSIGGSSTHLSIKPQSSDLSRDITRPVLLETHKSISSGFLLSHLSHSSNGPLYIDILPRKTSERSFEAESIPSTTTLTMVTTPPHCSRSSSVYIILYSYQVNNTEIPPCRPRMAYGKRNRRPLVVSNISTYITRYYCTIILSRPQHFLRKQQF